MNQNKTYSGIESSRHEHINYALFWMGLVVAAGVVVIPNLLI